MAITLGIGVILGVVVGLQTRRDRFERARRGHAMAEYGLAVTIDFLLGTLIPPPVVGMQESTPTRTSIVEGLLVDPAAIAQFAIHQDDGHTWAGPVPRLGLPAGMRPSVDLDEIGGIELLEPALHREAYHRRMRLKYDRAVRFPWLPVEPDPPAPPYSGKLPEFKRWSSPAKPYRRARGRPDATASP